MRNVAAPGTINGDMFDRFSLLHGGFGYLCGKMGVGLTGTAIVAIGWEFVEQDLKERYPHMFPHPSQDSPINAIGDVIVAMIGWQMAQRSST